MTLRLAATVLLARDGDDGLELFLVRRRPDAAAFPGYWVFPGGTVAQVDREPAHSADEAWALAELTARGGTPPTDGPEAHALYAAATRELREEAGVTVASIRELVYLSHWITPYGFPRRFDTRFFAAALPAGQQARPEGPEVVDGSWLTPGVAVERHRAGTLPLVLPTLRHLERLTQVSTSAELMRLAATRRVTTVQPTRGAPLEDDGSW
jgi:8-oxo-dGTP pyrophosphatase MutT (NUDIX family)